MLITPSLSLDPFVGRVNEIFVSKERYMVWGNTPPSLATIYYYHRVTIITSYKRGKF
jgi:hypothetical protein